MRIKTAGALAVFVACTFSGAADAQERDLGPQVKKLADGVYVHTGRGFESNAGIIVTEEGVIVIDTGQNPYESRNIWATVRNLTSMPVRFVIDTEPHPDHTTGHFMFSPPPSSSRPRGPANRCAPPNAMRPIASSGSPRHLRSSEWLSRNTGSSRRTSSTMTGRPSISVGKPSS